MRRAIEIESLSFGYKRELVLENISFRVKERDFFAIIGPNGGGKSTLLKLIVGLLTPQEGKISIFGESVSKVISKIGYVPQNTDINIKFPIRAIEVVMLNSSKRVLFGYSKEELTLAKEVLAKVGIKKEANSKIENLSGGQRQRVMIARALFNSPEILILDEPTSNIDVDGQRDIYNLLKELNKKLTIVVVSHDISILLEYANEVAYINKRVSLHNLNKLERNFSIQNSHFCEVELMQMLRQN